MKQWSSRAPGALVLIPIVVAAACGAGSTQRASTKVPAATGAWHLVITVPPQPAAENVVTFRGGPESGTFVDQNQHSGSWTLTGDTLAWTYESVPTLENVFRGSFLSADEMAGTNAGTWQGERFAGTWTATRLAEAPPQSAAPAPGDFTERDATFISEGIRLAGTIFLPASAGGPVPAVVVTHGSERSSRRNVGYRWIGENLARHGYAALIFDKRGVGDSQGEYEETPWLEHPAADVVAGARLLGEMPEVDARRVGVLGFSQGGWVGPLAAATSDALAFVVMLVGPAVSIAEQVIFHRGNDLQATGIDSAEVTRARHFLRDLYNYLGTGEGYAEMAPRYEAETSRPWFDMLRAQGFGASLPKPETLDRPIFDFFRKMRFDPLPILEELRLPILAVYGSEDVNVPTDASVRRLTDAQRKAGNLERLRVEVIEGMGHNLWERTEEGPRLQLPLQEILWPWLRTTTEGLPGSRGETHGPSEGP